MIEVDAGRHHRDRRAHPAGDQFIANQRRRREHRIRAASESRAEPRGRGLHEPPRQGHVVRILVVARVVGEDERATLGPRKPPRDGTEQERMVRMKHVEALGAGAVCRGPRPREGERELRIGRGRKRRIPNDARVRVDDTPKAGREHPRLVAASVEAPAQGFDGRRDAASER